jgi:hypothetical protein
MPGHARKSGSLRPRPILAILASCGAACALALGLTSPRAQAATVLSQSWEHGLASEVPLPSANDPLTGKPNQWLVFSGGFSEAGVFGAHAEGPGQGTQDTELIGADGVAGWPAGVKFFGDQGSETIDAPASDRHNLWHVQTEPQNVSINPFITSNLISLPPGDSPALPAPPGSGKNLAWFGNATSGTFCGTLKEVEENPNNSAGSDDGCETKLDEEEKPAGGAAMVEEGELVSPSFNLEKTTSAVLNFNSWFEVEAVDANSFDIMEVDYTTDEGTKADPFKWHEAGTLNPENNPAGAPFEDYTDEGQNTPASWQPILVDLSPAAGNKHVRVRFVFDTWDALFNGFRGWLIDNIAVAAPSTVTAPQIASVDVCSGTNVAPVTVIHGSNFFVGSAVDVDGVEQPAQTPSSTRLEIPAISAGNHTVQVIDPNGGAASNVFAITQPASCEPVPSPAPSPPASTPPPATTSVVPPKELPAPVLGKTVNVEPVSGIVLVKLPSNAKASVAGPLDSAVESLSKGIGFIPLTEARQIPVGSTLETTRGVVKLTTATAASGKFQSGDFGAGIFKLLQSRKQRGLTDLNIINSRSPRQVCASLGKRASIASKHLSSQTLGRLNANAHGKFTTRGQYSAATVRGTVWSVSNQCDGTLTRVTRGVVSVRDFRRRKTITLFTGQHYLARP